jgi:hypothetical protein
MGNKNCVHILVGNLMKGNSLGDLDVNGQLILKLMLSNYVVKMGTEEAFVNVMIHKVLYYVI